MSDPTKAWLARDAAQQMSAPVASADSFEACGSPFWSEAAWNQFRATYGKDPFSAQELPPEIETAPPWVFRRLKLRPPLMSG